MDVIEKQEADGLVKSGSTQDAGGVEEQSDGKKVFKCQEVGCKAVYIYRKCLTKHIIKRHSGIKYKCSKCPKVFASLDYVYTHVWKAHKKKFICNFKNCSYKTSIKNRFYAHLNMHERKKTYTWESTISADPARDQEPASTEDPARVEELATTADPARDKEPPSTADLDRDQEPASTSDTVRLEEPVTTTKADELQELTSKKLLKCEINRCSRAFTEKYRLNRHIRNCHSVEKQHKCSECSKHFTSSEYLKNHFIDCHSEKHLSKIKVNVHLKGEYPIKPNENKILKNTSTDPGRLQKQEEKLEPGSNLFSYPVKVFLPPNQIEELFDLSDLTVPYPPYQFTNELTLWFDGDFEQKSSCILKNQFFQKVAERKVLKKVERSLVYVYLEETEELAEIRRSKTLTVSAFKLFLEQLIYFGQGKKCRAFQHVKDSGIIKNQAKIYDATKRIQKHFLKKLNVVSIIGKCYYNSETTQMIEAAMLHGYAENLENTPLTNKMKGNLHFLKKWHAGDVRTLGALFLYEYFELYVKGKHENMTFHMASRNISLIRSIDSEEDNEKRMKIVVQSKEMTDSVSISECELTQDFFVSYESISHSTQEITDSSGISNLKTTQETISTVTQPSSQDVTSHVLINPPSISDCVKLLYQLENDVFD